MSMLGVSVIIFALPHKKYSHTMSNRVTFFDSNNKLLASLVYNVFIMSSLLNVSSV